MGLFVGIDSIWVEIGMMMTTFYDKNVLDISRLFMTKNVIDTYVDDNSSEAKGEKLFAAILTC